MLITNLNLTNYRSYSTLDLELTGGVSVFIGKNGEGKTNIAESILYLTFLNSYRASGNTPLIKLGNQAAYIRAKIKYPERDIWNCAEYLFFTRGSRYCKRRPK